MKIPSSSTDLNVKSLTVFRVMGIILLMLIAFKFIQTITPIFSILLAALLLSLALNPIVGKIGKLFKFTNRTLSTTIAFLIVIAILATFLFSASRVIFSRVSDLATNLPETIDAFLEEKNWLSETIKNYELDEDLEGLATGISDLFPSDADNLVSLLRNISAPIIEILATIVLILVFTFLLLIEGPGFIDKWKKNMPEEGLAKWTRLGQEMNKAVVGYINGQVIIALIGALFALIIMSLLGVDNALAMAAIVFFFSLVPLIGTTVGAVLVIFLNLVVDLNIGIVLAIYFIVYQQIENVTIQPWIQSKQTNLSVFQVLLTVLIGATVAGMIGVFLAIPLAACLKIYLVDYFRNNKANWKKGYARIFKP